MTILHIFTRENIINIKQKENMVAKILAIWY